MIFQMYVNSAKKYPDDFSLFFLTQYMYIKNIKFQWSSYDLNV